MKNFEQWLKEDFATIGVAPEGNVSGMGPVVAPTSTSVGSGDAWPAINFTKTRKKRKPRKKKKINESDDSSLVGFDKQRHECEQSAVTGGDPHLSTWKYDNSTFLLIVYSLDDKKNDRDFIAKMDNHYDIGKLRTNWSNEFTEWGTPDEWKKVRNMFKTGDYAWAYFKGDSDEEGELIQPFNKELKDAMNDEWKIAEAFAEYASMRLTFDYKAIMYKALSYQQKEERSKNLLSFMKHFEKDIPYHIFSALSKMLSSDDAHSIRGKVQGKKYNI